jgi:ribosomal protein L24E
MKSECFLCGKEFAHGETVYVVRREGVKVLFCSACNESHLDDRGYPKTIEDSNG